MPYLLDKFFNDVAQSIACNFSNNALHYFREFPLIFQTVSLPSSIMLVHWVIKKYVFSYIHGQWFLYFWHSPVDTWNGLYVDKKYFWRLRHKTLK